MKDLWRDICGAAPLLFLVLVCQTCQIGCATSIPPNIIKKQDSLLLPHFSEEAANSESTAANDDRSSPAASQLTLPCDSTELCNCPSLLNLSTYDPNSAIIPCSRLDSTFLYCELIDETDDDDPLIDGCTSFGARGDDPLPMGTAMCSVLQNVTCAGPRNFLQPGMPCEKFTGFRFPTALMLSFFLGCVAADRWYLGHFLTAAFKTCSCGGCLVWWFVDLILLSLNLLGPANDSSWEPFF